MRGSPRRMGVNKYRSASQFRSQTRRTKAPNIAMGPMRGGWRL